MSFGRSPTRWTSCGSSAGRAARAARAALELWRGAPLANVAGEPFAASERRRLEELRLTALELAIVHDVTAGRAEPPRRPSIAAP